MRRITAVTTDAAFNAIELASLLEQEVDETSKTEGSLLEKVNFYLFSLLGLGRCIFLLLCSLSLSPNFMVFSPLYVKLFYTGYAEEC